jgi:hypothetical protein
MKPTIHPMSVTVRFSDSSATDLQLKAFRSVMERELNGAFPFSQVDVAYDADIDAPVVAEVDGQPFPLLACFTHKVYGQFSGSAVFSALASR